MSFLDDLEPAEMVPVRKSSEERQVDKLRAREDRILDRAGAVIEAATAAEEFDDGAPMPADWPEKYGKAEAERRYRVACAAWRNKKDAPVFLEMAKSTYTGIMKAKEGRNVTVSALNVAFVVAAPPKVADAYPIIDVEVDDVDEK